MRVLVFAFLSLQLVYAQSVVRISDVEAINPAEVSVAIDPTNPDRIVAASLQYLPPIGISNVVYVSTDGGKAWVTVKSANPKGLIQGDDSVRFSADGKVYHSYISFAGIRQQHPKKAENGIYVVSSTDGGSSWLQPLVVINHENTVTPFEDKPYLAIDRSNSKHKGTVYIAWTRFDEYGSKASDCRSHIYFSRSEDGKFSAPIRISDEPGDCVDSDGTVEGAVPAIGPAGEVYVVWSGPKGLVMDKSTDGGLTFGKDKVIAEHVGGWDFDIDGISRCNGMPITAVDLSRSEFRGTLYVNWVDLRNGDADVFLTYSRDSGRTFAAPVRVNDDTVGNGRPQFFSWMAVDPVDGAVNIVFYDRRKGEGTETGLTLARSIDGGKTFVNYEIDLKFSCNKEIFFGDYIGIDAYGGRVVTAFMHFVEPNRLAISSVVFDFEPATQKLKTNRP